jgi:ligand-binding SRPBCC domain-containing protein
MRPQQEYVDEMLSGLFKLWKHSHKFVDLGSSTQVLDEIVFSFGYPGVGPILEKFALWQLDKIFSYRKVATLSALEIQSAK